MVKFSNLHADAASKRLIHLPAGWKKDLAEIYRGIMPPSDYIASTKSPLVINQRAWKRFFRRGLFRHYGPCAESVKC